MDAPPAVPNRLQYNIKATAVDSTNTMKSTPADGQDYYQGDSTARFASLFHTARSVNSATMSRFRMQLQVIVPNNMIGLNNCGTKTYGSGKRQSRKCVF